MLLSLFAAGTAASALASEAVVCIVNDVSWVAGEGCVVGRLL